ncbi:MAG: RsmF rRNA methyltransferase first C-terminal domain-containing protein [Lachnospiraceae bacterium]|nr:RsmF rRNA methyltransferase first C-terminal domain-containing protein [Lachnospiraceae bacterium]
MRSEEELPKDYPSHIRQALGQSGERLIRSFAEDRTYALRINEIKAGGKSQISERFSLESVPWCPDGYYYLDSEKPGRHPFHEAGAYYIQEPSAMAPVEALELKGALRVLDLCAAPGGKSVQIAARLGNEGILFSNEIDKDRSRILSSNIERMGIRNAIVLNEAPERLSGLFIGFFDRILVDAPCSGEGMFRKEPQAVKEWTVDSPEFCARRQKGILREAAKMLSIGGILVYSTCTFEPVEDEWMVESFLEEHEEFESLGMRRLLPYEIKGEGHFYAVLKKCRDTLDNCMGDDRVILGRSCRGTHKQHRGRRPSGKAGDKERDSALSLWRDFVKAAMPCWNEEKFIDRLSLMGNRLWLLPEEMPDMMDLKVIRTGLELGSVTKGRFEPAHALALSLGKEDARNQIILDPEGTTVSKYLNGQTLSPDELGAAPHKGWYLVFAGDFSLGWAKFDGRIFKNHYPRGLRK